MYISRLKQNLGVEFALRQKRGAWIQVIRGRIDISVEHSGKDSRQTLQTGDAVSIENQASSELSVSIKGLESSEFILFDLS